MRRVLGVVVCCVVFVACLSGCAKTGMKVVNLQGSKVQIERGDLEGSKIMIATPQEWNKKVLVLAHGWIPENAPLDADFSVTETLTRDLLGEGWMVASTSYRHNGFIVDEAVKDINLLREHIATQYGKPERVFLMGWSLGGHIVTQMAETEKYDGALAVGAALVGGENYSFHPRIPLIFLSNQNEADGPRNYVKRNKGGPITNLRQFGPSGNSVVFPAMWVVKRDGHCNVTDQEELAALRALFAYRETRKVELEKDATLAPEPPASVAKFRKGGALAKIGRIDSSYGNLTTQLVAVDLEKLGIHKGSKFSVTFNGKTVHPLLGSSYGDVPTGEWVAFVTAEGYVQIARNFDNAQATLGCKERDRLFVEPMKEEKAALKDK